MGSEVFVDFVTGTTIERAFSAAVTRAQYDHGHSGYTGSISEKSTFVEIPIPEDFNPEMEPIRRAKAWVSQLINECDDRIDDKWGPAGGAYVDIKDGKKLFVFFGWASS